MDINVRGLVGEILNLIRSKSPGRTWREDFENNKLENLYQIETYVHSCMFILSLVKSHPNSQQKVEIKFLVISYEELISSFNTRIYLKLSEKWRFQLHLHNI